jgi:glutathione S-transferase
VVVVLLLLLLLKSLFFCSQFVLYESEVINEWLEEQFPLPPLLPAHPLQRSKVRHWLFFKTSCL